MSQINGDAPASIPAIARDASQLAQDVLELAELHAALLKIEGEAYCKRLVTPVVLMVLAAVFALSGAPVLFLGGAYGLTQYTDLSMFAASMIMAGVAFGVACVLAGIGLLIWKKIQSPFNESKQELDRNMRWFKTSLRGTLRRSPIGR